MKKFMRAFRYLMFRMQGYELMAPEPGTEPEMEHVVSQLLTQKQIESDVFKKWCSEMRIAPVYHSKVWEYCYILQGLHINNMLREGMCGLGFGVGMEPLPAVMAKYGSNLVLTDLAADKNW